MKASNDFPSLGQTSPVSGFRRYYPTSEETTILVIKMKDYFRHPERSPERMSIVQETSKRLQTISPHWTKHAVRLWFNNNKANYSGEQSKPKQLAITRLQFYINEARRKRPELFSKEFFEVVYPFYQKDSYHIKRTKSIFSTIYPQLLAYSDDGFRKKLNELKKMYSVKTTSQSNENETRQPIIHCVNNFLYRNVPLGVPKQYGQWTPEESQRLVDTIKEGIKSRTDYIKPNGKVKWGLLSLNISGRTGVQCKLHFKKLVSQGVIQEIKDMLPMTELRSNIIKYQQPALLPYQEQILVNTIDDLLSQNKTVSSFQISSMAQDLFYEPQHLARKAAIHSLIDEGRAFKDADGNYIEEIESMKDNFLEAAVDEPQSLMNDFNIRGFTGSRSWVSRFMKRYGYTYRKAHFRRRGAISPESVQKYFNQLSEAFQRYGYDRVLNMDETHILVDNFSTSTIAKKGQQTVIVERKFVDTKAGTTYIGTICRNPLKRIPLYCIAKGKSDKCEEKYITINIDDAEISRLIEAEIKGECEMDHSESGWTTVDVMKRYLRWLSTTHMEGQPFALVLDIFKTHITQEIKDYAKELKIELIYVPANGTGLYQPLDRTIFGIVKQRLRKRRNYIEDFDEVEKHMELYHKMHLLLLDIWKTISNAAIESAWHFHQFEKYVPPDVGTEEEIELEIPEELDMENEEEMELEIQDSYSDGSE